MKRGDLVYYPAKSVYGNVYELDNNGRIKYIQVYDPLTKTFNIVDVLDKIIIAVGWIEKVLVFIRGLISKF